MVATGDLIFLGIQAGIRFARSGRRLYGEEPDRKLSVALPPAFTNLMTAAREHAHKIVGHPENSHPHRTIYEFSFQSAESDTGAARKRGEIQLMQLYLLDLYHGLVAGPKGNDKDWAGLAALKQWEKAGRGLFHPLQRQAPSLVEFAVDSCLANSMPLRECSMEADCVKALLRGLEAFTPLDPVWDPLIVALFAQAWEALFPAAGSVVALRPATIESMVAGLARSLAQSLDGVEISAGFEREHPLYAIGPWLLQSLLRTANARLSPTDQDHGALEIAPSLLAQVGPAFLHLLEATEEVELRATFQQLLESHSLPRLVKGVLGVIRSYPTYFAEEGEALAPWLHRFLSDLCRPSDEGRSWPPTLLTEAAVQLFEGGLTDLPVLARHPSTKQWFVVLAIRSTLDVLTEVSPPGHTLRWRSLLSHGEIAQLLEAVLGAWRAQPAWLLRRPGHQERAATLLPLLVQTLAELDAGMLKALLRSGKLQPLLLSVMVSGLSGKLSSFKSSKIAGLINQLSPELLSHGISGIELLLEKDRLTDLLTAIAGSKVADKLLGENDEAIRQACRHISLAIQEIRTGPIIPVPGLVERLNKGR